MNHAARRLRLWSCLNLKWCRDTKKRLNNTALGHKSHFGSANDSNKFITCTYHFCLFLKLLCQIIYPKTDSSDQKNHFLRINKSNSTELVKDEQEKTIVYIETNKLIQKLIDKQKTRLDCLSLLSRTWSFLFSFFFFFLGID